MKSQIEVLIRIRPLLDKEKQHKYKSKQIQTSNFTNEIKYLLLKYRIYKLRNSIYFIIIIFRILQEYKKKTYKFDKVMK